VAADDGRDDWPQATAEAAPAAKDRKERRCMVVTSAKNVCVLTGDVDQIRWVEAMAMAGVVAVRSVMAR